MRELPPSEFRYGNYRPGMIPFSVWMSKGLIIWLKKQNMVGYCLTPEFKPLDDYAAMMFRDEDDEDRENEYWCHIPMDAFKLLKDF